MSNSGGKGKNTGIATISFLPIRRLAGFPVLPPRLLYRPVEALRRSVAAGEWEDKASGIRPRNAGI
jgi:hypothetical protein